MSRTPFWREFGSANGGGVKERGAEQEAKGEGDRSRKSEGAGFLLLCFPRRLASSPQSSAQLAKQQVLSAA